MQELNDKIKKRIAPDHPRRRLLRYALDETILSTADYDRFPAWIDKQGNPLDALTSVPWLTELFWIRAFYEKADGYNVWTIFKNQFGQNVQESLSYNALRQFAQNLPSPFGSPDEFLRECWLVGGGNPNANGHITGMDSRVWKFLAPMVRKCPSADSGDDLAGFCQDFLDQRLKIPPHFEWLIQNEDTDFLKSLSVLHRQDGAGWLERVALLPQNILDCAGFDAGWMLYLNGNMRRIDLVVNNIYLPVGQAGNVSVRQGGRALVSQPAHGDSLFFWSDDLLAEGLNPEESEATQ